MVTSPSVVEVCFVDLEVTIRMDDIERWLVEETYISNNVGYSSECSIEDNDRDEASSIEPKS